MVVEGSIVSKAPTTCGTCISVSLLVNVHVGPKVLVSAKTLVTLFTFVRTELQVVGIDVAFQSKGVHKCLSTI